MERNELEEVEEEWSGRGWRRRGKEGAIDEERYIEKRKNNYIFFLFSSLFFFF
jgi:hypothetical protein